MQGALLLDVVVGQRSAILQLLACEDQSLLIGRNALLVLDLGLDVIDRVRRLHFKSDGLAGEGLDENLHTASQPQDEMQSRLLLNVVVGQSAAVLELLTGEDESLLVGRNTLLVLNFRLDIVDCVA